MRLADKVTIITGAGGGMGRVAAQLFAKEGAKVVVAEYSEAAGRDTVAMVEAEGGTATYVRADVSKEADAKAMVDHALATYGRVDVLYNNAGIMPEADHSVIDTDVDTWDQVMAVNVRGPFLGCKYAIPAMIAGGGGSIVNVASFVAILGCSVPQDAYTASKGAILSLTRSLAVQFGPNGIRTNAICPGPDRDAPADGLAAQGRGREEPAAGAEPDRPLRQARGDRVHGPLPRLGRVALHQRGVARRRRRHLASTTSSGAWTWLRAGSPSASMSAGAGSRRPSSTSSAGELRSDRLRVPTPVPSTPDAVNASIARLVKRLVTATGARPGRRPVGVGLPGVTIDGSRQDGLEHRPRLARLPRARAALEDALRPVAIVNDADAAGIAEMRFGVGQGPARASSSS